MWFVIVCDEDMLLEVFFKNRLVIVVCKDGIYNENYVEGGK